MAQDLYEVGRIPPEGTVPSRMYAQVIRPERFGEPDQAFQAEVIETPRAGPGEALVLVMAAGINYNNVWAARGVPLDVTQVHARLGEPDDFHIGGSDASGVVWETGPGVSNVRQGDHVVIHCGQWDADDPLVAAGDDPGFASSFRIWGYESNWGSFAQFTKVQAHQCLPKAPHLTWEQAAAPTLVGATAYRMLMGWPPHIVQEGDLVLTPLGQAYADASILTRKELLAGRILRLPIISWIYETLQQDDDRRVAEEYFLDRLRQEFGDHAEKELDIAINWGRLAELFAFDDDTDELYLEA